MTDNTREWVNFFEKAGIPRDVSASYAIIFNKNRIQQNMLTDLTKEYLKDMGIHILGDIIAILKHAQSVHEYNSRALIMNIPLEKKVDLPDKNITPLGSKSSTVKRLLDHYAMKYKEAELILSTEPKPKIPKRSPEELPPPKHEKQAISLKETSIQNKLEVPVQKKWKVPKETEGGYKITIPEKAKLRLLAKQKDSKTVFDRLGEATVSSSSDFAIKKPAISSSIFTRLGDASSTSGYDESCSRSDALPYAGVLKKSPKTSPTTSLRGSVSTESNKGIKSRLGISLQTKESYHEKTASHSFTKLKISAELAEDKPRRLNNVVKQQDLQSSVISRPMKRKSDELEGSNSVPKKVRFGATTHALIPSLHSDAAPSKTYPKLTIVAKTSVKERIGTSAVENIPHTSKMVSDTMVANSSKSSKPSIANRLGWKRSRVN